VAKEPNMMTIRSRWGVATVLAIALGAAASVGCTQTVAASGPSDPSPGAVQQAQADNAGSAAHEMHGPPGPEMLLFAALHHLDLKPEQRTAVENAVHGLAPRTPPDRSAFVEVAAGVRAGKLDEAAVLAKLDAAGPPADRTASLAGALDTLHATLTPEQRRALVDLIAKHIDEHGAAQGTASGPHSPLQPLLADLNLTSDQRASIDRILAAPAFGEDPATMSVHVQAFHAELRARLQTFASDRFDAAAFVAPSKDMPPMAMRDHVQRTLHALAAVLPVLDPAQREALATKIEAGPMHGH
jgi:Spy/CpxP family protein refolding chaperone